MDNIEKTTVNLIAKRDFELYDIWEDRIFVSAGDVYKGVVIETGGLRFVTIKLPAGDAAYMANYLEEFFEIKECDVDVH